VDTDQRVALTRRVTTKSATDPAISSLPRTLDRIRSQAILVGTTTSTRESCRDITREAKEEVNYYYLALPIGIDWGSIADIGQTRVRLLIKSAN
jgi:hypothetical protein